MELQNKLKELFNSLNEISPNINYDEEFDRISCSISEEIFKHTDLSDIFIIDKKGLIVSDKMTVLVAEDFIEVSVKDGVNTTYLNMDALSLEQIIVFLNKLVSNYDEIIKFKTIKYLF